MLHQKLQGLFHTRIVETDFTLKSLRLENQHAQSLQNADKPDCVLSKALGASVKPVTAPTCIQFTARKNLWKKTLYVYSLSKMSFIPFFEEVSKWRKSLGVDRVFLSKNSMASCYDVAISQSFSSPRTTYFKTGIAGLYL